METQVESYIPLQINASYWDILPHNPHTREVYNTKETVRGLDIETEGRAHAQTGTHTSSMHSSVAAHTHDTYTHMNKNVGTHERQDGGKTLGQGFACCCPHIRSQKETCIRPQHTCTGVTATHPHLCTQWDAGTVSRRRRRRQAG